MEMGIRVENLDHCLLYRNRPIQDLGRGSRSGYIRCDTVGGEGKSCSCPIFLFLGSFATVPWVLRSVSITTCQSTFPSVEFLRAQVASQL